jgi:hypothetical protein
MRPPGLRSDWSELVWRGHFKAPLRHAAVSLHRRQMRSPAHALGNGDRQIRHFLIFCSVDRSGQHRSKRVRIIVLDSLPLVMGRLCDHGFFTHLAWFRLQAQHRVTECGRSRPNSRSGRWKSHWPPIAGLPCFTRHPPQAAKLVDGGAGSWISPTASPGTTTVTRGSGSSVRRR